MSARSLAVYWANKTTVVSDNKKSRLTHDEDIYGHKMIASKQSGQPYGFKLMRGCGTSVSLNVGYNTVNLGHGIVKREP